MTVKDSLADAIRGNAPGTLDTVHRAAARVLATHVVIDRAEMPEASVSSTGSVYAGGQHMALVQNSADYLRALAYRYLAAAEALEKHHTEEAERLAKAEAEAKASALDRRREDVLREIEIRVGYSLVSYSGTTASLKAAVDLIIEIGDK